MKRTRSVADKLTIDSAIVLTPSEPARWTWRRAAAVLVSFVFAIALATHLLYQYWLRSSPVFGRATELASRSDAARALLGEPIEAGAFARGVVRNYGYAALAIPVHGPAGSGTLYVVANRANGTWDIARAVLEAEGPSRGVPHLDLTPPTMREPFSYPSSGRVYLQPLDEASEEDVKDLPAYYKARLNIDVVLLPARRLEPETIDRSANQVVAEQALIAMKRANPEVVDDVDAVLLGVTSQDLNIQTAGWNFAINYRDNRFGIVSTARLHEMPSLFGGNPAVYPVRVRKLVTKNVALMHYPLGLSSDPTSALAFTASTTAELDRMGERFVGESGVVQSDNDAAPCISILQGPGGKQSWRLSCQDDPPADSRFEMFQMYPGTALLVMARADFPLGGENLAFVRKYRPLDDRSRAFGIGATDSFDIFPVGDSQTFSWIELILADGGRVRYERTSPGRSFEGARLRAAAYMGSRFSLSSLEWQRGGWDLKTLDGWTYRFPASGPGSTWQQSALIGLYTGLGPEFKIRRNETGDLYEVHAPDGTFVRFVVDDKHRITSAIENTGRMLHYEYDQAGRLAHVRDSAHGDRSYEYDAANRLTAVRDGQRTLLINAYNGLGDIRAQTLANGEQLLYEAGYNARQQLAGLRLTLPNGYTIRWLRTRNGFSRFWPEPSRAATAISR